MVARDILRSIASLGKTLKITITAEGVETQEQVDFLRDIACSELQGYYFAKPLNEIDLARYFLTQFDLVIDRHGPLQIRADGLATERRMAWHLPVGGSRDVPHCLLAEPRHPDKSRRRARHARYRAGNARTGARRWSPIAGLAIRTRDKEPEQWQVGLDHGRLTGRLLAC